MSHSPSQLEQPGVAGKSVIVAGGGLAGIATALALARQGVGVKLFEARRRLGGRTGSFSEESAEATEQVDYCQHVGMGCCTNLKQLIDWLEQGSAWDEHTELHFYYPSGRYQRLAALPWLPAPLHLLHWLAAWPGLGWRDRLSISRGMLAMRRLMLEDSLDAQSALEWLQSHGQTPRGLEQFWGTIIVSALGEELGNVNLAAVCKVLQDGFLNHRRAFHLLVPNRPLDSLFNVEAAQRLIEAGVEIHLDTPIRQVARVEGRPAVRVREKFYAADAVVLALPWHALGRIAARSELTALSEVAQRAEQLTASPITGVHTWWDRPWLDHPQAALVGRLCQWVFAKPPADANDASDANDSSASASRATYYQIVISASHHLPSGNPALVQQMIQQDLAEVFPKSRNARLLRCKVVTDPQAVFSVAPHSLKYRAATEGLGEDLLLAGDWTRSGWPATMEGAIRSGFRAAEVLFCSWGNPLRILAPALCEKPSKEI